MKNTPDMSNHSFAYTFTPEDCVANIDFNEIWK